MISQKTNLQDYRLFSFLILRIIKCNYVITEDSSSSKDQINWCSNFDTNNESKKSMKVFPVKMAGNDYYCHE